MAFSNFDTFIFLLKVTHRKKEEEEEEEEESFC